MASTDETPAKGAQAPAPDGGAAKTPTPAPPAPPADPPAVPVEGSPALDAALVKAEKAGADVQRNVTPAEPTPNAAPPVVTLDDPYEQAVANAQVEQARTVNFDTQEG